MQTKSSATNTTSYDILQQSFASGNRSIQASLVQCAISHRNYTVMQYADMICIQPYEPTPQPSARGDDEKPTRGNITKFSNKSRKRMIEALAKVRSAFNGVQFWTVTYRDQEWFDDEMTPSDFQTHLDTLMKRIERICPSAGIIWRKEFKTRKSGDYRGLVAPHAHLIIFDLNWSFPVSEECPDGQTPQEWLCEAWSQITGAASKGADVRVDAQLAKNRRHAYSYMSKYTAKVTDEPEIDAYFDTFAGQIGRHWGIRGNVDMSKGEQIAFKGDILVFLKRLIRSWLKSKGKKSYAKRLASYHIEHGCSVFGLGDLSEAENQTIFRMVRHALELSECNNDSK